MGLTLYSYKESGNSYKVRLFAAIHQIQLEVVELDFLNDEQHSPKFLAVNPRGEVPCLVDSDAGHTLHDSSSILVYLAGKSGSDYWSTSDFAEQAAIVNWLAFANSWVQYGVFTVRAIASFKGAYNGLGATSTEQSFEDAKVRSYKSLDILEERLKDHDWLALDRPTIGDIAIFVYIALSPMGDIKLTPNVLKWIERVKALPNFIKIDGLDDPFYRRRADIENTHPSVRHIVAPVPN